VSISDDSTRYLSGRTAAVLIGLVCFIAGSLFLLPGRVAATPAKIKASASPLKVGAAGSLSGRHYRIAGHDIVEMAEVGSQFERHEFQLQDDDGNLALLVYGTKPKAKDWMLFTLLEPSESLTPRQAGLVTRGQIVRVGSFTVPVGELFRSTAHRASDSTLTNTANPEITFGFSGHDATAYLLARWDEDHLRFQQGKAVSAKDVRTAFGQATGK